MKLEVLSSVYISKREKRHQNKAVAESASVAQGVSGLTVIQQNNGYILTQH